MPVRVRLLLQPKVLHPAGPPKHTGPGLHAALLAAVGRVDRDKAEWLHGPAARPKPFCITPLLRSVSSSGPRFAFEVGVLLDDLAPDFMAALRSLEMLRIGHSSFVPAGLTTVTAASYADILNAATPRRAWALRFATPTTVRTGSAKGSHLSQPLPAPPVLFGSLARRWSAFALDRPLPPIDAVLHKHLCVVHHRICTEEYLVALRHPPLTGFVGEVEFGVVDGDAADSNELRAVDALASFATIAGVGDQTTKGMGVAVPGKGRGRAG